MTTRSVQVACNRHCKTLLNDSLLFALMQSCGSRLSPSSYIPITHFLRQLQQLSGWWGCWNVQRLKMKDCLAKYQIRWQIHSYIFSIPLRVFKVKIWQLFLGVCLLGRRCHRTTRRIGSKCETAGWGSSGGENKVTTRWRWQLNLSVSRIHRPAGTHMDFCIEINW